MNELLQIINTVLANRSRTPLSEIKPEDSLRNTLGLDSLDLAELTVRIEAQFDVDIFEDGIVSTVGQVLAIIEKN